MMSTLNTSENSVNQSVIFQSSAGKMSSRTLLEMFGHIVFSFTRGVAEHYNPDEPEFTPELFGYNAFDYTARSLAWYFKVDEMIYQEYSDRQHTTLDYQAASGFRVRVNDACLPNENEGMQESQPLVEADTACLLYTSPSPRDGLLSRMPSSA